MKLNKAFFQYESHNGFSIVACDFLEIIRNSSLYLARRRTALGRGYERRAISAARRRQRAISIGQ